MKQHWVCWLFGHSYEIFYESQRFGIVMCPRCGTGFTLNTGKIAYRIKKEVVDQGGGLQ